MSVLGQRNRSYMLLVFGNLIPVIGYMGFDWNLTESFMFYAAELCAYEFIMLPRIVIFVLTSDEYYGSLFSKLITSVLWIIYHLFLFVMAIWFLVHTAYAVSATTAEVTLNDIQLFIRDNYLAIIFILGEYIYVFYIDYIQLKSYKILPSSIYMSEIAVFYILLIVIIGAVNGVGVFFELTGFVYQLVMLLVVMCIKVIVQWILKKRKEKLLQKTIGTI